MARPVPDDASAPALSHGATLPVEPRADAAPALTPEERYERRGLLGVGGMGRVYLAWDQQVGREVALKEVFARDEAHAAALTRRFVREAVVTARLEHPGIVTVYDVGRAGSGPFYTMRVVRGRALSECVRAATSAEARRPLLRHVRDACDALAFAHEHGVVHRDVKPSNIMVGAFGETVVMDWGLAGAAGDEEFGDAGPLDGLDTGLTTVGAVLGTPQYLSPEQAAGERADSRSDVFGLGLALYEVVIGRPARETDATPDSARAATLATDRALELSAVPPELAAIIRRATARRPDERYPTATALAADLGAFLDGRRVDAHAYTNAELLGRLVRAWRAPLVVFVVALGVGSALLTSAFRGASDARDRAEAARATAEAQRARAEGAEGETRGALARAERALSNALVERLVATRADLDDDATRSLAVEALQHSESVDARGVLAELNSSPAARRGRTYALPDCLTLEPLRSRRAVVCWGLGGVGLWELGPLRRTWFVLGEFSGGRVLEDLGLLTATSARAGKLNTFRLGTGERAGQLDTTYDLHQAQGSAVAVSVGWNRVDVFDGRRMRGGADLPCAQLAGAGSRDGMWAAICSDGRVFSESVADPGGVHTVALSEPAFDPYALTWLDDTRAILGSNKGEIAVVEVRSGQIGPRIAGGKGLVQDLVLSDGGWLVAGRDQTPGPIVWDLAAGGVRLRLPAGEPNGVAFVPTAAGKDGAPLITWSRTTLTEWTIPRGRPPVLTMAGGVTDLALIGDDENALAVSGAEFVSLHDAGSGSLRARASVAGVVKRVVEAGAPGALTLSIAATGALRRWGEAPSATGEIDLSAPAAALTNDEPFIPLARAVERLRGGDVLWCPDYGNVWILDSTGRVVWRSEVEISTTDSDVTEGGDVAAVLEGASGALRVMTLAPAPGLRLVSSDDRWRTVAIAPSGDTFACAGGATVELVSEAGDVVGQLEANGAAPLSEVDWSPTGRYIAAGARDGTTWLWELDADRGVRTGRLVLRLRAQHERIAALAFPMDEQWLAVGSWDRTVRFAALPP